AASGFDSAPIWRLSRIDFAHDKWGWKRVSTDDLTMIFAFLSEMERLTWKEICDQQTGNDRRRSQ
ncbi:MAG: hypothetical protein ACLPKZ_09990, partial [Acidimicrobiales bacterium]